MAVVDQHSASAGIAEYVCVCQRKDRPDVSVAVIGRCSWRPGLCMPGWRTASGFPTKYLPGGMEFGYRDTLRWPAGIVVHGWSKTFILEGMVWIIIIACWRQLFSEVWKMSNKRISSHWADELEVPKNGNRPDLQTVFSDQNKLKLPLHSLRCRSWTGNETGYPSVWSGRPEHFAQ